MHNFAAESFKEIMWLWLSVCSAVLLGFYDVAKKHALRKNSVLWILLESTVLSALFLSPFLSAGPFSDHLKLMFKGLLVSSSWVTGLLALKTLPLTTASTIKASRPMFVVIFSIILFGERLNALQWVGVVLVIASLFFLSLSSKKEGIKFTADKGVLYMVISVLTGSASALYDKHILKSMEPLFVQSWSNVYIAAILGIVLLVVWKKDRKDFQKFTWDWTLPFIAILITVSDAVYFYAVKDPDALLSVISMIRRSSVIIVFLFGAIVYKENNIRDKAASLAILLAGIALLLFASR